LSIRFRQRRSIGAKIVDHLDASPFFLENAQALLGKLIGLVGRRVQAFMASRRSSPDWRIR
jgi:hypothetical protein